MAGWAGTVVVAEVVVVVVVVVVVALVLIDVVLLIGVVGAVDGRILMTSGWLFNVVIVTMPAMHVVTNMTNQMIIL